MVERELCLFFLHHGRPRTGCIGKLVKRLQEQEASLEQSLLVPVVASSRHGSQSWLLSGAPDQWLENDRYRKIQAELYFKA